LTDVLSGDRLVEKAFVYLTSVAKECRKALTEQFEQEQKGIPFRSVEEAMKREIEAWFAKRDPNIKLSHEKSLSGRAGEIIMTYSGSTKGAHFKIHFDGVFTLAGSSGDAASYLKNLNVRVDKREFTK
jgi:4-diphosphocytidyl-2C-methyl-D-erythritol kinase